MSKSAQRYSKKQRQEVAPEKPAKFVELNTARVKNILPKTENQSIALDLLRKRQLVVLGGASGSGKTYLASTHAANEFLRGNIQQIVLIRPAEPLGKTVGFKKGSQREKLQPLMQTMLDDIAVVVGIPKMEYMLDNGQLILEALEDCRGRSYKNAVVILDESQNADLREMKAILTRLEDTSQLILCGDWAQKDIKADSGLRWMFDKIEQVKRTRPDWLDTEDMNQAFTNIGCVIFEDEDIVRSGLTRFWVKVFNNSKD